MPKSHENRELSVIARFFGWQFCERDYRTSDLGNAVNFRSAYHLGVENHSSWKALYSLPEVGESRFVHQAKVAYGNSICWRARA
jgi:hypothetical protein